MSFAKTSGIGLFKVSARTQQSYFDAALYDVMSRYICDDWLLSAR